jgi:hypothetical protein
MITARLERYFTVEPIKSKKEEKRERLRLAFGIGS